MAPEQGEARRQRILAVSLATAKAAAEPARPAALQVPRRAQRQGAARADDEHPQRRRAFRRADRFPGIHDHAQGRVVVSPKRSAAGRKSSTR